MDGVALPNALARKYKNVGKEWGWQWLFPMRNLSTDPRSGIVRRHHMLANTMQNVMKKAVMAAEIHKKCACHTLRQWEKVCDLDCACVFDSPFTLTLRF